MTPGRFKLPLHPECTDHGEMPTAAAIDRVDQCVAPRGADSRVRTITSSTLASSMVRGGPGTRVVAEPVEAAHSEPRPPSTVAGSSGDLPVVAALASTIRHRSAKP